MIDQALLEYIKTSLAKGLSQNLVKESLIANGWQEAAVNEAIQVVLMPDVPTAPASKPEPAVPAAPLYQPAFVSVVKKPARYSHYSVFLAVVLFLGLLILSNKIISDIGLYFGSNITSRLIFDALIILPFLLMAFGLHYWLAEKGEKYQILSKPYYLVSGWLLIRLLFNVSEYILSSQVVYGVYIVLILVVVVLTTVVFFVQKFIRHKE